MHGELTNQLLSEYSHMLLVSGYNAQFRIEAVKAGVTGYRNQCGRADAGISPLHRLRDWDKNNRWKKKKLVPSTWYRPADSVMFCPPAPGSELKKEVQKIVTEVLTWINGKEVPKWGAAEIQKMSSPTTGRCK